MLLVIRDVKKLSLATPKAVVMSPIKVLESFASLNETSLNFSFLVSKMGIRNQI